MNIAWHGLLRNAPECATYQVPPGLRKAGAGTPSIACSFSGDEAVNFDIDDHAGKQVVFPAKQDGVSQSDGLL